ncbi:hypothetical protein ACFOWM_09460 [Ferruginibacter yonginensis]|uniref:Uncharacterized protein n=1 Tax=Ferruginibacter yonginensis TaxID=1310416 RepID=A0ABV8QS77_9BACT
MKYVFLIATVGITFLLAACKKDSGLSPAVGGDLPTNYIIVSPAGFDPINIAAVRGSTFTFVNRTGNTIGIYSLDSLAINKQGIANNTSYIYKKDTLGTIIYRMAGFPSITGSITITP